eukprot:7383929-Prymnesium_polylepis.1
MWIRWVALKRYEVAPRVGGERRAPASSPPRRHEKSARGRSGWRASRSNDTTRRRPLEARSAVRALGRVQSAA